MKSTYVFLLISVITTSMLIVACSDSSTGPTTQDLVGSFTTSFDFIPVEFSGEGEVAVAQTPIDASGSFDGFGTISATLDQVVDFTVVPTEMISTAIYVFENGDELWTEAIALSSFPDEQNNITFTGTHTLTGGTGRFESASGEAEVKGGANLTDMTGYFELTGEITY